MDPRRLRRGRLLRRDRRARARAWPASATSCPTCASVWQIDAGDLDRLPRAGAAVDADGGRRAAGARAERRRPRHDHLHQRHHRPAQGLRADPPQHVRPTSPTRSPACTDLFHEGALDAALPAAGALVRPADPDRRACRPGSRIGHTADVKNLVDDLQAFQPTFVLVGAAGVREGLQHGAKQRAHADGKGAHLRPGRARSRSPTARRWTTGRPRARAAAAARALRPAGLRQAARRARRALHATRSPAARRSARGSAHFFRGIGVTVYEGYGLTETSPAAAVNLQGRASGSARSAGRCPASRVRIADDGEILIKGDIVFRGYWNNPDATAEALDADGWFHTGDLGELDDDGYLTITGRKKEIIVTAGGKNVAPAVLEDRIRAHPLVSQCVVVGDRQPFIAALVTIDEDAFPALAGRRTGSRPTRRVADLRDDETLRAEIQDGDRRRQQGRLQGRGDPGVPDPARRLHRGDRRADPVAEGQAQRRAEGVRRRDRRDLRR